MSIYILRLLCLVVLGFMSATTVSCAAGASFKNLGKIKPSEEATRIFENHKVLSNYRYYLSGSDLFPDAVIGLDKAYVLDSDLWKEIELTPAKLKDIVESLHIKSRERLEMLHGFDILDDKGNKIGIWYSILRAATSVRMEGGNKVLIYTPPLDIWEYKEGGALQRIR